MEFSSLLALPTPFLIQKGYDFTATDADGLTLMHYAVASNSISKVQEMLSCGLPFSVNGQTANIPVSLVNVKGKEDTENFKNKSHFHIPYCATGCSPLHLSVYLHAHYSARNHPEYSSYSQAQEEIFMAIAEQSTGALTQILRKKEEKPSIPIEYDQEGHKREHFITACGWLDKDGLSVTDYCLLALDFALLSKIALQDPQLDSLNAITIATAHQILDLEIAKNHTHTMKKTENGFLQHLSKTLKTKELKINLTDSLEKSKNDKTKGEIKI